MRLNSILGLVVSTIIVAGCADGNSVLSLNLSTPDVLTGVDHVTITVTDVARNAKSRPAQYAVSGGMIPPAQQIALVLPAKVRGAIHVDASVEAADGTVLGLGGGDYMVAPSKQATGDLVVRSIEVLPDAGMSTVTVDRPTGVAANGADASVITVKLVNVHGTPLAGVAVQIMASGMGASLSTPDPTGPDGSTTSSLRSTIAETDTVTVTALGVTLAQQPTVMFVAGGPVHLTFLVQPTASYAQKLMTPVQVQIQDDQGNVISTGTNTITLALSSNSANASVIGVPTVDAVAGLATFDVIGVDKAAQGLTLTATSPGLASATSTALNVADYPWQLVTTGLYGGSINSLAVAPAIGSSPITLYADTYGGVFTSTNLAATWTSAAFGLNSAAFVVVDPSTAGTAYTTGGAFIVKTANGGIGWKAYSAGTTGHAAEWIAVNPTNPAIVYAGNDVNLFKSTDGGKHWSPTTFGYETTTLAVDPNTPSTIYASGHQAGVGDKGLFKSTDAGASWAAVSGLPTLSIQSTYALPTGIFVTTQSTTLRSTDGGATWTDLMLQPGDKIAAAPSNPMTVYAELGYTLKISTDGGATFPTSKSSGNLFIYDVVVHPTNPNELFFATPLGVYVSTDAGTTLTPASVGISNLPINAIALNGSHVTVGTNVSQTFHSIDAGNTWTLSTTDPNDPGSVSMTYDPVNSALYMCALGFHISMDDGATFGAATSGAAGNQCGRALFASSASVFVGGPAGIFKSTDRGMTWTASALLNKTTFSLAGKGDGTTVFAGINPSGIYRSTDSGTTWSSVQATDVANAIVYDDNDPTHVYSGLNCTTTTGDTGGFRVSSDTGTTWGPLLKPGTCVSNMADVSHLAYLMATASVNNVATFMRSADKAQTWSSIPVGLYACPNCSASTRLMPIAASSDAKTVYVGTFVGLYRSLSGGM